MIVKHLVITVGSVAAMSRGTERRAHIAGLDGLRAVAVTAVVLYHATSWFPGGGIGVDVFFALSGFLITSLLLAEAAEHERVDLPRFWGRRALRLFPALALMLVFVCVYLRPPVSTVLGVVFYVVNWPRAFGVDLGPLSPTWSLAVEEQFYLMWPVVIIGLSSLGRGALARRVMVASALGCVVALGLRFWLAGDVARIYHGTDTRMDALLVGAFLAAALADGRLSRWSAGTWRLLAATSCAGLAAAMFFDLQASPVAYTVLSVASMFVVAGVVLDPSGPLTRVLSLAPLVWIGRISYGMYLWHFPLQFLANDLGAPLKARFPFVFAASVLVAWLSFSLVERPLQHRFRHLVRVPESAGLRVSRSG